MMNSFLIDRWLSDALFTILYHTVEDISVVEQTLRRATVETPTVTMPSYPFHCRSLIHSARL